MNRIYELAKEAGLIEFDAIPGSNAVTPNYASVVKSQKFAELIVRECVEISQVGSITESKLKQHFGIQE